MRKIVELSDAQLAKYEGLFKTSVRTKRGAYLKGVIATNLKVAKSKSKTLFESFDPIRGNYYLYHRAMYKLLKLEAGIKKQAEKKLKRTFKRYDRLSKGFSNFGKNG